MTPLPQDILLRVERVQDYHRASKYNSNQPKRTNQAEAAIPTTIFKSAPKVALETRLLDASAPAVAVIENGREALPDSQMSPPQDLKTLSTWLFMSDGLNPIRRNKKVIGYQRTCPSSEETAPCEIYVVALAIDGLEPGLYHFSSREYALRKLRDGHQALSLLKRGRPDLEFIKTTPGVILVSTVFARSASRFGLRGYRAAMNDAGQLMENFAICGNALGVQTITRMRTTESTTHELIGVPPDASFDDAESVQAMIIWADPAEKPFQLPAASAPGVPHVEPIARQLHQKSVQPFPRILETQKDCVAPGVAVRDVRPPLTELTPMPANAELVEMPLPEKPLTAASVFRTLTRRRPPADFHRRSIPRSAFLTMNHAAFRGGSHFPLFPDGSHVALIRPFWIIHDVVGVDPGVWYYHPPTDRWTDLDRGDHRMDCGYLTYEQPMAAHASAVCFMFANLNVLMNHAGPDLYRLAHLEAGIIAQRLYVAANSLGLGCALTGEFYDDEVRKFLGLDRTGWEPIHAAVVGISTDDEVVSIPDEPIVQDAPWDM